MIAAAHGPSWRERFLQRVAGASFSGARARGAVVLAFHQIELAKFAAWVRLLREHFELVSLDELVRRRTTGESMSGLLALTFDDGWADTCEPVAELCEREGWPVMMYVVSRAVGNGTSLWFAELPPLVRAAHGRRVECDEWVIDCTSKGKERASTADLIERLKVLPGQAALRAIEGLRVAAGLPPLEPHCAFVGPDFVRRYKGSRWVKFGSHTADHQALAAQPEASIRAQWTESQAILEAMVGEPIRHFAYPYGAPNEYGAAAPGIVGNYYDSAVTMVKGVCSAGSDMAQLPRVPLYDSDGGVRMIAKIALAPWI